VLTVLLIRHASFDHVGHRVAGRAPGTHLNTHGREQARRLGRALAEAHGPNSLFGPRVVALYTSPQARARETAEILAGPLDLSVEEAPGLDELDFGEWTGKALDELDADPRWRAFNAARGETRIPGGELMCEAVDRAVAELAHIERRHPGAAVAAVSHADVIRGVLLRCLRMPLDEVHRLEVAPASVSLIEIFEGEPGRVLATNWTPDFSK